MVGGDLKMVGRRPGIWLANASCSSSFELGSRKKKGRKEEATAWKASEDG